MCALGNASDANNSLADAFDADLFAAFCADTELADVIDSAMYEARGVGRRSRIVGSYPDLPYPPDSKTLLTCARGVSHVAALHGSGIGGETEAPFPNTGRVIKAADSYFLHRAMRMMD